MSTLESAVSPARRGWSTHTQRTAEHEGGKPSAIPAFAAGTLSLLLLLASLQPPPATPAAELSFAASHRTAYGLFATLVLAWSVPSVPSTVASAAMLQRHRRTLASSARILSIAGVLLLGYGIFIHVGALLPIVAAGAPPRPEDAVYQPAIWSSLRFYLTDPGLMTWALGQLLSFTVWCFTVWCFATGVRLRRPL
jgi:hypothetical protein